MMTLFLNLTQTLLETSLAGFKPRNDFIGAANMGEPVSGVKEVHNQAADLLKAQAGPNRFHQES